MRARTSERAERAPIDQILASSLLSFPRSRPPRLDVFRLNSSHGNASNVFRGSEAPGLHVATWKTWEKDSAFQHNSAFLRLDLSIDFHARPNISRVPHRRRKSSLARFRSLIWVTWTSLMIKTFASPIVITKHPRRTSLNWSGVNEKRIDRSYNTQITWMLRRGRRMIRKWIEFDLVWTAKQQRVEF